MNKVSLISIDSIIYELREKYSYSPSVYTDFQKGVSLHNEKNKKKAFVFFKKISKKGVAEAHYNIALMYRSGDGINENKELAVNHYVEASNLGCIEAKINLGHMYATGLGVEKDKNKASKLYLSAAQEGDRHAQLTIATMYRVGFGDSIPRNIKQHNYWLAQSMKNSMHTLITALKGILIKYFKKSISFLK